MSCIAAAQPEMSEQMCKSSNASFHSYAYTVRPHIWRADGALENML